MLNSRNHFREFTLCGKGSNSLAISPQIKNIFWFRSPTERFSRVNAELSVFEKKVRTGDLENETPCLQISLVKPRNRSVAERNEEFRRFEPTRVIFHPREILLQTKLLSFELLTAGDEFIVS